MIHKRIWKKVIAVLAVIGLFCVLGTSGCSRKLEDRSELVLSGKGWKVWLDSTATWEGDVLYLPDEVDLASMSVNPPMCGWSTMYKNKGIECTLPACVEEIFSNGVNSWRYHGVSWFWKEVDIPTEWKGKTLILKLAQPRLRVEIYVNEQLAGYDLIAEVPYEADISRYLDYGVSNTIALRITNPGGQQGWADFPGVKWGEYTFPAGHDFGGIGGDVVLEVVDDVYIDNVFVKNVLPTGGRRVEVKTTIKNKRDKEVPLTLGIDIHPYPSGKSIYSESWSVTAGGRSSTEVIKSISAPDALLWDLDHPNLYYCVVSIGGPEVSDEAKERFGFRTFEVKVVDDKHNFYLNGKRIRLRSAIDWGYYALTGLYATEEMAEKSVSAARAIGHNSINFHRRIGEPLVMKYADELGLYLYEEPGGFHIHQGYNIEDDTFAASVMQEKCRRMVIRDRNHPSLLIFNLCNEDNGWNTLREKVMRMLNDLDGTRLITNTSGANITARLRNQPVNHIRPYENSIRGDCIDDHTVSSRDRFQESDLTSHFTGNDSTIVYWGEVRCYTGPSNWYLIKEMQDRLPNSRPGYDINIYEPLHDKIASFYSDCNLSKIGSRHIRSEADVSRQAGRGLMYINGRLGQVIMCSDSEDGYAINGWSSGCQLPLEWDSAILDEGRNLKGVAYDFAYWTRDLQVAILRQNGKYFDVGDIAKFDVHLINEGKLEVGKYTLKLRVKDGNGAYTEYSKNKQVTVAGGDTYAQKFLDDVSIAMDGRWKGGYITVEGKLYRDKEVVASGAEQVLLRNRASYKSVISPFTGAVCGWPAAKAAIRDAGVTVSDYSLELGKVDYITAGSLPSGNELSDILKRVKDEGTLLIIRFDSTWAEALNEVGILLEKVTTWGGEQTGHWTGNGWGYVDYFIGDQAIPGGETIGTNSWEVPGDPRGFYPFKSGYRQGAYGAYFARHDTLLVIIGTIDYGKGMIVLDATYPIDEDNVFNDMLFYKLISMPF